MPFLYTTATKKIRSLTKKIRAVQGGTSASKTISINMDLIDRAQKDKAPTLTSIVSESMPHIRRGCIRDFKKIMKEQGYWKPERWSQTEKTYTFETGSEIEFFGADDDSKLRGGRRDRGFMNECNNISFQAFEEFEVRTREFIYLDWNPTNDFWYDTEVDGKRTDVSFVIVNFMDNEACPPEIRDSILQRQNRKGWWKVYGLGQKGEVEGKIYKNWPILDTVPPEAKLVRRGLDYGYTNDPSAVVAIYKWNDAFIIDEECYQKGLSNKQIYEIIAAQPDPQTPVVPDSSEPKSNDELQAYGLTILPANKGWGSVKQGIQYVQALVIFVTKRSTNIIKENRNYLWKVDKNGKVLNEPEHQWSHSMDAIRYALESNKPIEIITAEDRARDSIESVRNLSSSAR